jgi:hypothetical protein
MKAQRFMFLAAAFAIGAAGYGCSSSSSGSSTTGGTTGGAGGSGTTTTTTTTKTTSTSTSTSGGGSGQGGGTSTGGSGQGGGGTSEYLGAACSADGDCGAGLRCITSTTNDPVLGGGPAGGYCSKDCAQDTDCPGDGSLCLKATKNDPKGICLLGCTLGPALTYINDPQPADKCQGREDVRCAELQQGIALCLPTCGEDVQCDGGKVCDPRAGVCVDKANTGLAMGAKCDPNAQTPDCAGVCLQFSSGAGGGGAGGAAPDTMCSEPCVMGGKDFLNQLDCGGATKGLCAFAAKGAGSGDFGYCTPACKSQEDCQFPLFACIRIGGTEQYIDNGYCLGGADTCTAAEEGKLCANSTKLYCTNTSAGYLCLDKEWPLGKYAPQGAGGAGGGK